MNKSSGAAGLTCQQLAAILEAALLADGGAMSLERMASLFDEDDRPLNTSLREALEHLESQLQHRGVELVKVASGYRLQVRQETMPWVSRLWEEKPPRYSRALLETLALIAYRQPVTRGDIEDVRGVVVSSNIIRTLLERDWIKVVGHRDVPGRPSLYATTSAFLDYFGLSSLDQLPSLMAIRELDEANRKLAFGDEAEARQPAPQEYRFENEEAVAQRGNEVLDATAVDLQQAAAMVARVEQNLFGQPEQEPQASTSTESEGRVTRPRKNLGDLLNRLEQSQQDSGQTPHAEDADAPDRPQDSDL